MLRLTVRPLLLVMALLFCVSLSAQQNSEEIHKLDNLLDEIWQYKLTVSPLLASREGKQEYDHLLPDLSPKALESKHKRLLKYQQRLSEIEDSKLDKVSQINKLMQDYVLANEIDSYNYNSHFLPLTSEYGFHSALATLPDRANLSSLQGVQNYLARLRAIPDYFDQNKAWMRKGMAHGIMHPKESMLGFEDSISAYITSVEDNVFFKPMANLPQYFDPDTRTKLKEEARKIVSEQVIPAYKDLYAFMVEEYLPAGADKVGVQYWPNGEAFYRNRAVHYTTTDLTPEAIHEIGLAEVKRIRAEKQAIIEELNFDGDFADFVQFLRTDPQFYASSAEELIKEASYIAKQMDAKLPALFEKLPRTPYGVAPVPDAIAPKYTTGRYVSPRNDLVPGYYWVNTYALDKRPLYALPALTLHEAVPGHHLQIMLANENTGLPPVRKTYISAFGEGWGLYSEYLGIEAGIYKTPYENFGRLSYEMWRACRLVVDTGLHLFGWTRQEAITYMLENTALSEHNIKTEVDRYITWPAQALSYKIGEIKIRELRKQAESQQKENFDIRKFHSAVLEHGSVPLFILEENVRAYMNKN